MCVERNTTTTLKHFCYVVSRLEFNKAKAYSSKSAKSLVSATVLAQMNSTNIFMLIIIFKALPDFKNKLHMNVLHDIITYPITNNIQANDCNNL